MEKEKATQESILPSCVVFCVISTESVFEHLLNAIYCLTGCIGISKSC